MVKASEFKNVCKAINDRKLAELKKEIIEILKKQDEKEFKKAIDLFESQEFHYTHLEKSIAGKWIQKAGYGVGTVRIWKGKKYKKIAPGKWARVFDKEGRGTNIAIGKLIAKVQKIDNVEDLMAFVMQNKQRFVDENGIDLPVLDKLRAAVDAKNNGGIGSKTTSKPAEKEDLHYSAKAEDHERNELVHKIKSYSKDIDTYEAKRDELERDGEKLARKDNLSKEEEKKLLQISKNRNTILQMIKERNAEVMEAKQKLAEYDEKKRRAEEEKPAEKKGKVEDYKKQLEDVVKKELVNQKEDVARLYEIKDRGASGKHAIGLDLTEKDKNTSIEDRIQEAAEWLEKNPDGKAETIGRMLARVELAKEFEKNPDWKYGKKEESEAEKTQNRSEAMKGNKNAYKGVEELEKMSPDSLQEYVDEMHNKIMKMDHKDKDLHDAIETWKNAERIRKEKLHAANELRADFETKLLNRLQDGIEKQKEACEEWDLTKMSDNQLSEYIKAADKWKDKGLVHLADPIIDKWVDSGKDTYDNNDFVGPAMDYQGFAVAHSKAYDNMKKELESRKNPKVEEPEKKAEEPKETPKEEKPVRTYNIDNSGKAISYDELKPIATNKSVGENEVQMPYSKDLAEELETLKNCVSKDNSRQWMQHVYYEDGNLVATDVRRLKVVKVGELEGIPEGSYVDINTDKSGISIKKRDMVGNFPNYKRVIPDNLNQSVKLDTKLVKDKIKEMRKDGAIDKKGANLVQLEFRDGKVFIDDVAVGEAKDIRLKSSRDWGETTEETKFVNFNADYLVNALSGKTSILQMGDRGDKAMAINTGSSSHILMPMSGDNEKHDYSGNRKAKDAENEAKDKRKAEIRKYNEAKVKEYTPKNIRINIDDMKNRMKDMPDEELKRHYDMLNFNLDKVLDKKQFMAGSTNVDSKLKLDLAHAVAYKAIVEKYPEVKEIVSAELEKRGVPFKKSIWDNLFGIGIEEDIDVEIEDEEEPEGPLFDDYSAEQPELFNSTEMMVSEAFNRCGCSL